jgi:hypothetical protein
LVFPGTTVVFLATWLYMGAANPNRTTETADPPTPVPYDGTKSSIWLFITALSPQVVIPTSMVQAADGEKPDTVNRDDCVMSDCPPRPPSLFSSLQF